MIHGVMEEHANTAWTPLRKQLEPTELKRVLKMLAQSYQFITVKQCVDMLEGTIEPIEYPLLITFDDGYRNNLDYALPICQQLSIKPVIFVATGHIDSGQPFWFDRLDYALQQNMGQSISLRYQENEYCFDGRTRKSLALSFKKFRDDCKQRFSNDIEMNLLFIALSEMLEARAGKGLSDLEGDDDWSALSSWTQLRQAVEAGLLDVASHGVDHWRIDRLDKQQALSQLVESKRRIEAELPSKCDYFCYPNGNYNNFTANLLKKSGYHAAFSTDVGLCNRTSNLMALKRFNFPTNKSNNEIIFQFNR